MDTKNLNSLYRDALDLYRATSKMQAILVMMFLKEFNDLEEEEARKEHQRILMEEDPPY